MDALNIKLSNLEKLKRYLQNSIPDIYDKEADASMQQSSVYAKYHGLCYSILKESVIAENGFTEYEAIQSEPETELSLPSSSDFIKISHDTLKRISAGLKEDALIFFTSFYEKIHKKSNMSFETELIAYTMLFWILRGKKDHIVAVQKANVMAFLFAISPNILPYLYRWLHTRQLSLYKRVTIHSPRLDMLTTLIDKGIDEIESKFTDASSLLSFLESNDVIKEVGNTGCYVIVLGRRSLNELFRFFERFAVDISDRKIVFPNKRILFKYIVKDKNLTPFSLGTIDWKYSEFGHLRWLFYNDSVPEGWRKVIS